MHKLLERQRRWMLLALLAVPVAAACGSDGSDTATGANADSDGDGILDKHEGADAKVNTDEDRYPDYLDADSDGDGILDALEAGDDDPNTPPIDTDGDEIPDFRDTDSDDDGILDSDELDADFKVVDSDGDGTYDHLDTDSDGDNISDKHEGLSDANRDGVANFRDDDSDGDGIPDLLEAGDDSLLTPPVDTDQDGQPNFLDADSDGDHIPDAEEDKNGNGVVDAGESSPLSADTDGDGVPDLVELIAGSDPADKTKTIPPGDFYFVLPYQGPGDSGTLDFSTTVRQADIFFSMDTTASFGDEIAAVQTGLDSIVTEVSAAIGDTAFGVGRFEDMPLAGFGTPTDVPYELLQSPTTNKALVAAGIAALPPAEGGLDIPESGYEALYQWASGSGLPELGLAPFAPAGLGGVGFRKDSLPIIIHITDAVSHKAADYGPLLTGAHSRDQAVAALNAIGARVIGINSLEHGTKPEAPRLQLEDLAIATRAVIPPDATSGKCHMGSGGSQLDPQTVNGSPMCPVVFDVLPDGSGLGSTISAAVLQLAQLGVLDISSTTIGQNKGLKNEVLTVGHTTADFIKAVTAIAPVPAGATIAANVFVGVTPGSTVNFSVDAFNDFQLPTTKDQLFAADIQVIGDGVTVLDTHNVFIIVPREEVQIDVPK